MLAGSTMNTFAEPLENIFRINKREGQRKKCYRNHCAARNTMLRTLLIKNNLGDFSTMRYLAYAFKATSESRAALRRFDVKSKLSIAKRLPHRLEKGTRSIHTNIQEGQQGAAIVPALIAS